MADNSIIKAIVITVSDSRTEATDVSGVTLVGLLIGIGAEIVEKIIVSDDFENLRQTLFSLTMRDDVNLIITTGGTGFSNRDNTPEATRAVI
jgi:molybdenum cofactor biosynthesis protein B